MQTRKLDLQVVSFSAGMTGRVKANTGNHINQPYDIYTTTRNGPRRGYC